MRHECMTMSHAMSSRGGLSSRQCVRLHRSVTTIHVLTPHTRTHVALTSPLAHTVTRGETAAGGDVRQHPACSNIRSTTC